MMSIYPSSFAASEGGMVGADSVHSSDLMDKNGKYLSEYEEIAEQQLLASQEGVMKAVSIVNAQGNGSENGGVYLDCSPEKLATARWMYRRNAEMIKDTFGYDMTTAPVEVIPEMYEHGGEPIVDNNAMCVDCEGLFVVRANSGSQGGNINTTNRRMGRYATQKAIEYVQNYEEPESVTFETVATELARLEDLRTREISDSLRPVKVRRNIQYACAEAARPERPTEVLEKAQTELERIMSEDIPRMACVDKSLVSNADWKDAIETINLLDMARLTVAASLERKESRAAFIRPEYPNQDDDNYNCMLAYTRASDGSLSFEKITY
jgi:succinate dehydrogenase/fumarate reductase flavoprotein subunit